MRGCFKVNVCWPSFNSIYAVVAIFSFVILHFLLGFELLPPSQTSFAWHLWSDHCGRKVATLSQVHDHPKFNYKFDLAQDDSGNDFDDHIQVSAALKWFSIPLKPSACDYLKVQIFRRQLNCIHHFKEIWGFWQRQYLNDSSYSAYQAYAILQWNP